jgi:hypothetical protein
VLDAWTSTWLDPDFASWTLAPTLPRVACPVLAIHGSDDEYGSMRHPEMIASRSERAAHLWCIAFPVSFSSNCKQTQQASTEALFQPFLAHVLRIHLS